MLASVEPVDRRKPVFMPTGFSVSKPENDDPAALFDDIADAYADIQDFRFMIRLDEAEAK